MTPPSPARARSRKQSEIIGDSAHRLLLPPSEVHTSHYRLYSYVKSAKKFGGDWWGCSEVSRKGKAPLLNLAIGDATGHGVPAAILAATVRGAFSIVSEWASRNSEVGSDPREILKLLNRVVYEAAQGAMVMTLCAIVYDPTLGVIRTANAGHCFPYVVTPGEGGSWGLKSLGGGGVPLGHSRDTDYLETDTYTWVKGSKLVLYTDGLIDVYDGDRNLFDRRALQRLLRQFGGQSADQLLKSLMSERKKIIGRRPQADDLTAVVAELD